MSGWRPRDPCRERATAEGKESEPRVKKPHADWVFKIVGAPKIEDITANKHTFDAAQ